MATLNLPMTNKAYYTELDTPANKSKINEIINNFGNIIGEVSVLCNVPKKILASVIFIESAGKKSVVSSSGAVGLMQIKPDSAHDILVLENVKKRFSNSEKAYLTKWIGKEDLDSILGQKFLGENIKGGKVYSRVNKEDLLKPELNIFCGAIYLGQLIDLHTENGVVRMDKIILRYNKGYFYKPKGDTTEQLMANAKTQEAQNYITKMVGKNGILTNIA